MGSIFIIQGTLIYIYAFDHRSTLVACLSKNDFIDEHEAELMEPMEQRVQNETCFNFAES
ncbi:MAG: hypothetical protein IJT48_05395 [Bacteroidaceae bacterium]|nr:hypothetical protein [Bacteroidaceae bacterium]